MDAALSLGAAVLVLQVLKTAAALPAVREPQLVIHLLGRVHVSKGGEAHVGQWVVGHIVLAQIRPAVLEAPHGQGVQLLAFPYGQRRTFSAVVPPAAVDPAVGVLRRYIYVLKRG